MIHKQITNSTIRERIREIATEQGGPTILARTAGLAPSTVTQYLSDEKGRASAPGVDALIRLADASGVSISWLAAGRGPKSADCFMPEGFRLFPYFDLRAAGWRIHALSAQPGTWVALKTSWIDRVGIKLDELICFDSPDDFPPVNAGDLLAVDPSRTRDGRPITLAEGRIHAIAPEARILLRTLEWDKSGKLILAKGGPTLLKIEPFQVIGLVTWRGGSLDPELT